MSFYKQLHDWDTDTLAIEHDVPEYGLTDGEYAEFVHVREKVTGKILYVRELFQCQEDGHIMLKASATPDGHTQNLLASEVELVY